MRHISRLLEAFEVDDLHDAVNTALCTKGIGFDATRHLVLCQVEKRSPGRLLLHR